MGLRDELEDLMVDIALAEAGQLETTAEEIVEDTPAIYKIGPLPFAPQEAVKVRGRY